MVLDEFFLRIPHIAIFCFIYAHAHFSRFPALDAVTRSTARTNTSQKLLRARAACALLNV